MLYGIPFFLLLFMMFYGVLAAASAGVMHLAIICGMLAVLPAGALVLMAIEKE